MSDIPTRTRDGSVSIASLQMEHDSRDCDTAPTTMEGALEWAVKNRMKPTGNNEKDLAAINRMRELLKIPPFSIIGARPVAKPTVIQPAKPREEIVDAPRTSVMRKSSERTVEGLIHALFDELDEVRAGRGDEIRIKQVCLISVRITELLGAEIKFRKARGTDQ